MADPWNVVLGGSLFEQRIGVGAVGALHVFEFDDGDAGSGGRAEGGGIVDRGGGRATKLGACSRGNGEKQSCGDEGRQGGAVAGGEAKGAGEEALHSVLDDSLLFIVTA